MNKIPEKIIRLRFESLYRTLNEAETGEMEDWMSNHPDSIDRLTDLAELFKDYLLAENYSHIDKKKAWMKIKEKASAPNKIRNNKVRLRWAAAVASVFIAVVTVSLYLFVNRPAPDLIGQIKPGSSKAMLELSDGEQFFLTDVRDFTVRNKDGIILGINKSNIFIFDSFPVEDEDGAIAIPSTITVPYGGEYRVQLPDRSIVVLNSGSTLRFPNRFNEIRRVELEGEAWFEITENKQMPFEVSTKHSVISVLGTKFNVSSYAEDKEEQITLVEGKIAVRNNWRAYQMSPGEHYVSSMENDNSTVFPANVNLFISWKDGIYRFQNMRLADIMPKFERWYNVKIKFEDEECAGLRFTGAAERHTNLEEFLRLIESTSGVKFTLVNNQIVISKRTR